MLDIRARVGEINRGLAVVGEGAVVRVELAAVILYAGIRRVSDGDPVEIEGAADKAETWTSLIRDLILIWPTLWLASRKNKSLISVWKK